MLPRAQQEADPRFALLSNSRCVCRTCGQFFNSTSMFDKHRYGEHGWNTRKCRTEAELLEKGYAVNKDGFWVRAQMPTLGFRKRVEGIKRDKEAGEQG